jgi:type IV secretory pathway TrbL component
LIANTRTKTGLQIRAGLDSVRYPTGIETGDDELAASTGISAASAWATKATRRKNISVVWREYNHRSRKGDVQARLEDMAKALLCNGR